MAVVVIQQFEASTDEYDKVTAKIDPESNPPDGLILHCGADIGGGKMKVVDIWDSADAFQTFADARLGPAIGEVMGEDASEPQIDIHELHDLYRF
jgi:hypothetical protein